MDRLIPDVAGEGVAKADLVIEAIVENAEVKRKLFAQVEPRMKEGAILASNTSSIPLQELAAALERPERLVGLHFFNPVAQMMLVEIVESPRTAARGDAGGRRPSRRQIDKLPLPCKSAPGFLVNRVLSPYLHRGDADGGRGHSRRRRSTRRRRTSACRWARSSSPTWWASTSAGPWARSSRKPGTPIPKKLQALIEAKHLGKKTGQGFYTWVKGKARRARAAARWT